jgi:hypothetical protein
VIVSGSFERCWSLEILKSGTGVSPVFSVLKGDGRDARPTLS